MIVTINGSGANNSTDHEQKLSSLLSKAKKDEVIHLGRDAVDTLPAWVGRIQATAKCIEVKRTLFGARLTKFRVGRFNN